MTPDRIKELRDLTVFRGRLNPLQAQLIECLDEIESQAQRIAELEPKLALEEAATSVEIDKAIAAEHALTAAREQIVELEGELVNAKADQQVAWMSFMEKMVNELQKQARDEERERCEIELKELRAAKDRAEVTNNSLYNDILKLHKELEIAHSMIKYLEHRLNAFEFARANLAIDIPKEK